MNEGFSLTEQIRPINHELNLVFTPKQTTTKFSYVIVKDGLELEPVEISSRKTISIPLTETGVYQVRVTEYGKTGTTTLESGEYHLDLERPVIVVKDDSLTIYKMKKKESVDFSDYVRAFDPQDGNISDRLTSNIDTIDLTKVGLNQLTFTVSDEAGNVTSKTVPLNVVEGYADRLLAIQIFIIIGIVLVLWRVLIYRRSLNYEKRLAKYSVEPIRDSRPSVFDRFMNSYHKLIKKCSQVLKKSHVLQNYSRRYEKYLVLYHKLYEEGIDFVSCKVLVSFGLLIIAIFSKTIQYQVIDLYEVGVPMLFGFFLPDLLFFSKYKLYRNQLENDLLQAIIIMNNAFKSGRSITQAVDLVTHELTGPMSEEFKKMALELSFGLSVDVVFERFSSRVQLEEVAYLTASLSILNRTGGNIIKVFSSIEKSLFSKKKLKLELASLTGSSKIIVVALIAVPILFVVFISLISPSYLSPFYTTQIGLLFSGIILIIYLIYIWLVRKIMKVRM